MRLPEFTVEHVKQLPLRAIVAFAARCARRVEHLAQLPEGHPGRERRRAAVEAALGMAEGFASGAAASPEESVVEAIDASRAAGGASLVGENAVAAVAEAAHAAATAWQAIGSRVLEQYRPLAGMTTETRKVLGSLEQVTTELVALDAFTAVAEAHGCVGYHNERFVAAVLGDYDRLLHLKLGRYPEQGGPIDPSPGGPLGPF
jgi:hypothetical protein